MSSAFAQSKVQARPATKVVIRLLPPTLTEETFTKSIGQDVLQNITWINFVSGKRRKASAARVSVNSRAYINFSTAQLAEAFCKMFHGHSFVDEKGEIFRAVVCLAPYQKVPRFEVAKDRKANTMETDPLYLEFINSENEPKCVEAHPASDFAPSDGISSLVKYIQEKHRQKEEQAAERKRKAKEFANATLTKSVANARSKRLTSSTKNEVPGRRRKCRGRRRETVEEKEFFKKASEQRPTPPLRILEREKPPSMMIPSQPPSSSIPPAPKRYPRRPKFSEKDNQYKPQSVRVRGRKEEACVWRPTILKNLNNRKDTPGETVIREEG